MYIHTEVYTPVHMSRGQKKALGLMFSLSSPYSLEIRSPLGKLAGQQAPSILLSPLSR